MSLNEIAEIIEGVLFVAGEGVEIDEFKTKFDMNDREFNKCLDILKAKYNENSGINIIQYKNKVQLCSNPKIVDNISEILNPIRERSLTKAALETVAIIAYKQPITRLEIENIRGANSDYAIQLLQSNNLIEVVGRKDSVGKPLLFGTTDNFLKRFELQSIEALPNYNELLDRIRVIHSEGDSLYREFTIPEDDEDKKPTEQTQNEITEPATNQNDNTADNNLTNEQQNNEETSE
ncbi:MAG TPA: SMC-Scp complex subunit ScpB [Candidatus Onthoplasma faecipullorum]|nr:SMC-Scp complex subunit ScpB [Candidatus Onthoplasma faecipullorum]